MADRKISDLTALTAPAAGDYLPIVDISEAAAANKNKRITIEELFRGIPLGTAAAPSIAIEGDEDTGVYSPGANQLAISTGGSGRLFVDASGRVGIGTSSISTISERVLHIYAGTGASSGLRLTGNAGTGLDLIQGTDGSGYLYQRDNAFLAIGTNNTERARIDSSGNILKQYGTALQSYTSGGSVSHMMSYGTWNGTGNLLVVGNTFDGIVFGTGSGTMTEKARFDASGRLLVGTSSARANTFNGGISQVFQIEGIGDTNRGAGIFSSVAGESGAYLVLGHQRSGAVGGNTAIASGDDLGLVSFQGSDGTEFVEGARIAAIADGGVSANDMPTRLVFSTTADGAASPTERMRIRSNGVISTFNSVGDSLNLYNASSAGASNAFLYGLHSATNNVSGGTTSIIIYTNGNVVNTNNSYGAISDAKLKENIVDATSQWDDIKAFQVRKYNFKEGQTHTQIGLVAQEVELVSPGLVSESPDRDAEGNDLGTVTKSVNYSVLYMKAVKALQEAMERIEVLEQRLNDAGIN